MSKQVRDLVERSIEHFAKYFIAYSVSCNMFSADIESDVNLALHIIIVGGRR